METVTLTINKKNFFSEKNGYNIAKATIEDTKEKVSLLCYSPELSEGDTVEAWGEFRNAKKKCWGRELVAKKITMKLPQSDKNVKLFLTSGLMKGVGPATAKKIIEAWGAKNVFKMLDENPDELYHIKGVSAKKATQILNVYREKKMARETIQEIITYGFEFKSALAIFKEFGGSSKSLINLDLYEIPAKIHSIGFQEADRVGLKNGFNLNDPKRIKGCIYFILSDEKHKKGNTAINIKDLISRAERLLSKNDKSNNTYIADIENFLEAALMDSSIFQYVENNKTFCQTYKSYKTEENLVRKLNELKATKGHTIGKICEKIKKLEKKAFELTEEQKNAVTTSLVNKVSIINGGPGVGKTTILKFIADIVENNGFKLKLCAPTGKAAQKMSESTGKRATTIHRMLEWIPHENDFKINKTNPLDTDFLVVDEASMIDLYVFEKLTSSLNNKTHLIIIGDTNQLPSVGAGSVLKDLIKSQQYITSFVTKIQRQAEGSRIIDTAYKVNNGEVNEIESGINNDNGIISFDDFVFIDSPNDASSLAKIKKMTNEKMKANFNFDFKTEVQLLAPMHKGDVGTISLNKTIQERFENEGKTTIRKNGFDFKVGDNVMQTANNYDKLVFNGDVGVIKAIDSDVIKIEFDDNVIDYGRADMDDITLAYCSTVHKSQGSEYPCIIILMPEDESKMIDRSLLYTAITRAKKQVMIVGSRKTFNAAVNNVLSRERTTGLLHKIENI